MRHAIIIAIKFAVFLPLCACWIWWSYSMRASIHGGFYVYREALSLVIKMAFITTGLTTIVWVVSPRIHPKAGRMGIALRAAIETAILLIIYTSAVVIWRDHWTPAKGITESAQFMPLVGHVNAAFFAEFLWLEYLIVVVPAMSVLSGLLAFCMDAPRRTRQGRAYSAH